MIAFLVGVSLIAWQELRRPDSAARMPRATAKLHLLSGVALSGVWMLLPGIPLYMYGFPAAMFVSAGIRFYLIRHGKWQEEDSGDGS